MGSYKTPSPHVHEHWTVYTYPFSSDRFGELLRGTSVYKPCPGILTQIAMASKLVSVDAVIIPLKIVKSRFEHAEDEKLPQKDLPVEGFGGFILTKTELGHVVRRSISSKLEQPFYVCQYLNYLLFDSSVHLT